jgi:DNA repair exonuclease SbcCD nuclease subunit
MFQFIHAADIHLDSPLKGLANFDSAPVERIRSATRDAFRNLIHLALDEQVAFVLIAGDLWDCDWPDAGPGLFFISQVRRLDKAGIPVFIVKGNHDAESQLTNAIRNWPRNVSILSHKKPQTIRLEQWNVAIHGQSYPDRHATSDLSAGYPAPVPGAFNIGILHTCLDDGDLDYAPACLDTLVAHGYQYWALGHLHDRRDLSREGVHIEFPGNLQGRSMRETGPKGCTLVTVNDDHSVTTRFQPLDVVRWQGLHIAADDSNLEKELRHALEQVTNENPGLLMAIRLHITGHLTADQALYDRVHALAVEVGEVWIEKIQIVSPPATEDNAFTRGLDPELRELLKTLSQDQGSVAYWFGELSQLRNQLSGELAASEGGQLLGKPEVFQTLITQIVEEL